MMDSFLYDSPVWVVLLTIFGTFISLTLLGLMVTTKILAHKSRIFHNDFVGFSIAVVGVIYAVMLAFVAVAVWEDFRKAEEVSIQESSLIESMYRHVLLFPEPVSSKSAAKLRQYIHGVIEIEWPAMNKGGDADEFGIPGAALLDDFFVIFTSENWKEPRDIAIFSEVLQQTRELYLLRSTRLQMANSAIHPIVWFVIRTGAILTIAFSFLFGMRSLQMHMLISCGIAISIALVVIVIAMLDFPFRGEVQVKPDDFQAVLRRLESTVIPPTIPAGLPLKAGQ